MGFNDDDDDVIHFLSSPTVLLYFCGERLVEERKIFVHL
jgi:hypothetical protein